MRIPRKWSVFLLVWTLLSLGVYVAGFVSFRHSTEPLFASASRPRVWTFPDTPTYRIAAGVYAPLYFCLNESVTFDDFSLPAIR